MNGEQNNAGAQVPQPQGAHLPEDQHAGHGALHAAAGVGANAQPAAVNQGGGVQVHVGQNLNLNPNLNAPPMVPPVAAIHGAGVAGVMGVINPGGMLYPPLGGPPPPGPAAGGAGNGGVGQGLPGQGATEYAL